MTKHSSGTFMTAAVTVGSGATLESTLVGGSDFTSRQIDLTSVENIAVTIQATGANAGVTGVVSVDFVVACQVDTPLYDTAQNTSQVFSTVSLTMTTNAAERTSAIINVEALAFIGVGRIRNADVAFSADVQVYWGKYERL